MILLALALTAVAEVADAVVDEDTRLQDGRHGGRHGAGAGGGGRRGSARRVLVDDEVIGGRRGGGGGGHVAAAEEAREGRRKAGADAASEGSREHFPPPFFPCLGRGWVFFLPPLEKRQGSACSSSINHQLSVLGISL